MDSIKVTVPGSALVTVVVIMTIVMVLIGTIMHSSTLLQQFSIERVNQERTWRASQALLNYGIAQCHAIDGYKDRQAIYTFQLDPWPQSTGNYAGNILVMCEKDAYRIEAQLNKTGKRISWLTCTVHKKDGAWIVL